MASKTVMANGKAVQPRFNPALIDSPAAFVPDADVPMLTMRELKEMKVAAPLPPVDVAALRKRLGMSQGVFARTFGLSVGTVRDWEQKRCQPDRPAQVLLRVIDREPQAALRALAA
jgi:DNA-binding transcriptional regulator YiaG